MKTLLLAAIAGLLLSAPAGHANQAECRKITIGQMQKFLEPTVVYDMKLVTFFPEDDPLCYLTLVTIRGVLVTTFRPVTLGGRVYFEQIQGELLHGEQAQKAMAQ